MTRARGRRLTTAIDAAALDQFRTDAGTPTDLQLLLFRLYRAGQGRAKPDEAASVAREARRLLDSLARAAWPAHAFPLLSNERTSA